MVVTLAIKNKFSIIFSEETSCDYILADNLIAEKWFAKIKHLKNIPIDPIESKLENLSNLQEIYEDFCKENQIEIKQFENIKDQNVLNELHKLYEDNHDKLSRINSKILYKFHHAIHSAEEGGADRKNITVAWGTKEGLLAEQFNCNPYYAEELKQNNIYLRWAELGKTPLKYWQNNEPSNQARINELCKPHTTLRAQFNICLKDFKPKTFDQNFVEWFAQYKDAWLKHHKIANWDGIDEYSAVLLAHTDHKINLSGKTFVKIVI